MTGAIRPGRDGTPRAGLQAGGLSINRIRHGWTMTNPRTAFSAGLAVHRAGTEPRQTLARADDAMYNATHNGRDRTEVFAAAKHAG